MEETKDKYEFSVSWEPFLLRPNMPKDGIAKPDNYVAVSSNLKVAGEAVGINFTGLCKRFPNTVTAHALLEYVKGQKQNELAERIFQGYFTDGIYPDLDNLLKMAAEVGLDQNEAKAVITDPTNLKRIEDVAQEWAEKGVSGVPYFIMNGQKVFSGAQDKSAFVRMFEIVTKRFPIQSSTSVSA